jgi:hypothetical protein
MSKHELTPKQQELTASRMEHDLDLIRHGAEIDANGTVTPTLTQNEALHSYMSNELHDRKVAEFKQKTSEGRAIQKNIDGLEAVMKWVTDSDMQAARVIPIVGGPQWGEYLQKGEDRTQRAQDFIRESKMKVEQVEAARDLARKRSAWPANEPFRNYTENLNNLAESLAEDPRYSFGSTVSVMRTGSPVPQHDWVVDGITYEGKIHVSSPDSHLAKNVPLGTLDIWNGYDLQIKAS